MVLNGYSDLLRRGKKKNFHDFRSSCRLEHRKLDVLKLQYLHLSDVISTPENWLLTKEVEIMTEIFALCQMHSPT